MTGRKIEIQEMPSGDAIYVHFNFELKCDSGGPHFYRPIREEGGYWNKLPDETKRVVKNVMSVDGVSHITVYVYELRLEKGRLFDFSAMANDLSHTMHVLFGADTEILISPLRANASK
jgi:hypothetical protein